MTPPEGWTRTDEPETWRDWSQSFVVNGMIVYLVRIELCFVMLVGWLVGSCTRLGCSSRRCRGWVESNRISSASLLFSSLPLSWPFGAFRLFSSSFLLFNQPSLQPIDRRIFNSTLNKKNDPIPTCTQPTKFNQTNQPNNYKRPTNTSNPTARQLRQRRQRRQRRHYFRGDVSRYKNTTTNSNPSMPPPPVVMVLFEAHTQKQQRTNFECATYPMRHFATQRRTDVG